MNIYAGPDEDLLTKELNLGFIDGDGTPMPSLRLWKRLGEMPVPESDGFVGELREEGLRNLPVG